MRRPQPPLAPPQQPAAAARKPPGVASTAALKAVAAGGSRRGAATRQEAAGGSGRAIRGSRAAAEKRLSSLRDDMDEDDASDDFVASDSDEKAARGGKKPARRSARRGAGARRRDEDEDSEGVDELTESDEDDEVELVLESELDDDDAGGAGPSESEPEEVDEDDMIRPVRKRQAEPPAKPPPAKKAKAAKPALAQAPATADEAEAADAGAPADAAPPQRKKAAKKAAAPKNAAAASTKGPIKVEAGDTEATFENVDEELWAEEQSVLPSPLPTRLAVLELFAGCGGLHLEGGVSFCDEEEGGLSIHTLAAVEIENDPARTYKYNHPSVNVMQMGVGRFLGTARRLHNLQQGTLPAPTEPAGAPIRVLEMKLDDDTALLPSADESNKGRSLARQDKDSITVEAARGERPLAWLLFRVLPADAPAGQEPTWTRDVDTPQMREAVHAYLNNAKLFGPHVFPLPGDVHVVTGGPPCQGWSGYNTTRVTSRDIMELMAHKENRLLGRFLEVVWFYRPMYMVMEEVPDVAKKPEVMTWMELVLQNKGYSMTYEKRLRTGLYGCPQTRDRLIVLASMNGLPHPAMPPFITAPHARESDNVQYAFDTNPAAYPITMRCHADGTTAAAEAARRAAADAELAAIDAQLGEESAEESRKLAKELKLRSLSQYLTPTSVVKKKPPVPRKKKVATASAEGDLAAEAEPEPDAAETSRRAAAAAALETQQAAEAERAAAEEARVAGLMRALVLGDAISCDLPVETGVVAKKDREAPDSVRHSYLCPPPTPYIAYLRQDMAENGQLKNHTVLKMKLTDHIRCQAVPYRAEMCWRDMAGPTGNMCEPQAVVLTDEEWLAEGAQFVRGIPKCMYAASNAPKTKQKVAATIPPLLHGWKLEKNRVALVPYWCVSMKHGKDKGCYGRLPYTEPHDTVHSYALPHWHVSLLPYAPRCLSVREKARVQGFPDSFTFLGQAEGQFKQIANAVSPQLGKAIGRTVLLALRAAHLEDAALDDDARAEAAALQPRFSKALRNFAEFLADFDEASLPRLNRPAPVQVPQREFAPMTYEEILCAYRTNTRVDHSVRYNRLTPFDILRDCEANHSWHLEAFVGIRRKANSGPGSVQLAGQFLGFDAPEWVELGQNKHSWAYKTFHFKYKARVNEVLSGQRAYWCLPGVDPHGVDVPATPQLDAAKKRIDEYDERYREELQKGWHFRVGKLHKKANRRAEVEDEGEDEEHLEEPDEYDEGGADDDASPDAPDEADGDADAPPMEAMDE